MMVGGGGVKNGRKSDDVINGRPQNVALDPEGLDFFDYQLWPFVTLQLFKLDRPKVPHLKDLIHICF